ncbi:MAG: energy transducer TonB [Muribaculaceae bacterium]|jgi:protein TonB|nr:energy transducer TonB [Muribaculaceae bacterium]MBR0025194.1 energy transducer TonB [Muribaculaceae bacterium]
MAKDVDLSSKEWLDLIFEGKNKDFGAYELRSDSPKRHNKSVIYTLIGIAIVALLAFGYTSLNKYLTERRLEQERLEQEALAKQMEQEMEEEEIQQEIEIPEEKEQVLEEEIQNSQKVTEMNIVDDSEVKEPPKTIESQKEDERQVGAVNEDRGSDDITKPTEQAHQEVVPEIKPIVEPPKEEKKEEPKPEPKKEEPKPEKDEVFQSAAHMPSYPGGDAALMKYLSDHLRYPQAAADNNIQGKVIVQFVVEKNGKIGEVKVARSVDKDLDREAIRVCKSLPAFSPGRNAVGDPVRVWYTLPVQFKLQGVN